MFLCIELQEVDLSGTYSEHVDDNTSINMVNCVAGY